MAEGSIASSITSTSHTLTQAPGMSPSTPAGGAPLALLDTFNRPNRHAFLQPPAAIPSSSLNLVKDTLESFAARVGDEQQRQVKEANRKRKRSEKIRGDEAEVLKIRRIHVDGFETGQVWQQARKVIASTLKSSEDVLRELEEQSGIVANGVNGHAEDEDEEDDISDSGSVDEDTVNSELDELEDGIEGDIEEDEVAEAELDDENEEGLEEEEEEEEAENIGLDELEAEAYDEMDGINEEEESEDEPAEDLIEDVHGLNDGFFSIDGFNKQTQWFEEQDARGDPNTDLASDDEEVNWDADPFAPTAESKKEKSKGKKSKHEDWDAEMDEDEDEDDEDDGPTFGNMDLYAPEGDSDIEAEGFDAEVDDDDGGENANDVYYKDFFAPPPRKKKDQPHKEKKVRFEPDDAEVDRAMADVKRDLFEDVSDMEDSEDALSDASAGDPRSRRSTHERRQAKIIDEIRKLEAAAVAKREWTLSGEASAVERPVNSLLEENLDFEHIGKPVPVITPEVTESIEDLIKRRILANDFDDILRRRPDADAPDARRGLVQLDDTKSKKGLAEIYEEEHLKNTNPDTYVSKADEKLKREEEEVAGMWRDVCAKLDALSSWHYKPKPATPAITVVSDVATVAMEDAQPATSQGVAGGESAVAPQEVYRAGKDNAEQGEVVRGGLPVAREEMSREEKTRRRRRAKERGRKSESGKAQAPGQANGPGKGSKKDTVADLKKGGVRVINRRGEILDVEGNKAKPQKAVSSGGYKL